MLRRGRLAAGTSSGVVLILFVLAHVPLALLLRSWSPLAALHALAALGTGVALALVGRVGRWAAFAAAYVAGAEVLWRMCKAPLPWEVGKYAGCAILLARVLREQKRLPLPALLYFVLLLPSVPLAFSAFDAETARREISFNLSGPFSLFVCVWFFAGRSLSGRDLVVLATAFLGPAVGILVLTVTGERSASAIAFGNASNFATSGGYGPNQVSSVLGLAALLAFLCVTLPGTSLTARLCWFGAALFLAAQSALTFSRSGLYMAGTAAGVFLLYALRDRRARLVLAIGAVAAAILGYSVIWPWLDGFTGGALAVRFQNTGATGRDEIALADLKLWAENPLLGVGPGVSQEIRQSHQGVASHTEYTRCLAEHGILGLGALILLSMMAAGRLLAPLGVFGRGSRSPSSSGALLPAGERDAPCSSRPSCSGWRWRTCSSGRPLVGGCCPSEIEVAK